MATDRKLSDIALEVRNIWALQGRGINYAAKPYLEAMMTMDSVNQKYGHDDGKDIVQRFLLNATTWRGEDARRLKAELKGLL